MYKTEDQANLEKKKEYKIELQLDLYLDGRPAPYPQLYWINRIHHPILQGEGKQEPDSYVAAVIGARERFLEKGFWGV